jgi:hypothetical protein
MPAPIPSPIPKRQLGKDGPILPAMGLGLMSLGHAYGDAGDDEARLYVPRPLADSHFRCSAASASARRSQAKSHSQSCFRILMLDIQQLLKPSPRLRCNTLGRRRYLRRYRRSGGQVVSGKPVQTCRHFHHDEIRLRGRR